MLTQSADTADDERNIWIAAPNRPPDDTAKSKRWRYGLASALGQKQKSAHVGAMSALPPKADIAAASTDVR
jgi:hypothetical protein